GVAVDAVEEGGDVDVDDVAVLEGTGVGDAVADDLVDAAAQRLREAAVAQRRGVGPVVAEELVPDPVELVGGDARLHVPAHLLQRLRGQPAGHAHPLDRLGVLHEGPLVRRGRRLVDVLRARDVGGHRSAWRDRPWLQRGHDRKSRKRARWGRTRPCPRPPAKGSRWPSSTTASSTSGSSRRRAAAPRTAWAPTPPRPRRPVPSTRSRSATSPGTTTPTGTTTSTRRTTAEPSARHDPLPPTATAPIRPVDRCGRPGVVLLPLRRLRHRDAVVGRAAAARGLADPPGAGAPVVLDAPVRRPAAARLCRGAVVRGHHRRRGVAGLERLTASRATPVDVGGPWETVTMLDRDELPDFGKAGAWETLRAIDPDSLSTVRVAVRRTPSDPARLSVGPGMI